MHDQAATLRSMLYGTEEVAREDSQQICVFGAKNGVGTSTIARLLANSLQRKRVACEVRTAKDLHGGTTRSIVADYSNGLTAEAIELWHSSTVAFLVTTPEAVTMLDAYAKLKRLGTRQGGRAVEIVFNQCNDVEIAHELFERLHATCRQHLLMDIRLAGCVPLASPASLALPEPTRTATSQIVNRAIDRLVQSVVSDDNRPSVRIGGGFAAEIDGETRLNNFAETTQHQLRKTPIHRRRIVTP